jgi:cellulose synthase/poly-beta-1,6-N-acetylglucosamine synthase-like glycosyltransferase/glycosyltransferase involved in cell wall biosynthesis/O-antigen/teichoic acid export membrane protein
MNKVDIVVPVLNEAKSLFELTNRIGKSLTRSKIPYGIIVVDDHSTDNTKNVLRKLSAKYPITILFKRGKIGKAYSILEAVENSSAEYIAMIDGDLQYAPEYIPELIKKAQKENLGIVIGNRKVHHESRIRQFISKVGHAIYAKLILGMNTDTQSGLKLFRREIIGYMDTKDIKPWAFDLPLIHTANELGMKVGSIDIDFERRRNGKSKVNFVLGTIQVLVTALALRLKANKIIHLLPDSDGSMLGAGVVYKKRRFITHTTLHHSKSALVTFTFSQKLIIFLAISAFVIGLFLNSQTTAIVFIGLLSFVYFLDVFFGLYLVLKSLHHPPEITFDEKRLKRITDEYLPVYSILCPLYHEAQVLPQFVKNIEKLDWPKEKLDVMLLLEEDDKETLKAAKKMNLPAYFHILVVPDSQPKTKPKACNYGLAHAKGEYVVIYDAEDAPEPEQLKKAFLGFSDSPVEVFCLQAKLNYYNPHQNILTRLFTAEYSLWFDIVLPGLQSIQTSIPLGGTSNHFRTEGLRSVEGWDPFNVAEDADLGARLFRAGYKTAIIDSMTLEEANSNVKNWIRQRSRWLKGYMQTYFVQMREPLKFIKEKKEHYFIFQLVSGLRVSFMLINPFLWAMTLAYFLLYRFVGPQIEALYPTSIFYMAVFSAVFGNFLYIYYYMIGAAKREQWSVIKYVFLVPFYWLLTSVGAFVAIYQLIVKPHFWEKTVHGLTKVEAKEKKVVKRLEFKFIKDLGIPAFPNVKALIKSEYFSGAFLIGASMFANVLNFLYNAYLSRRVSLEDFGLIGLVGSFLYLTTVPLSALSSSVTHKSAYLLGKYSTPIKSFWAATRKNSIKISIVVAAVWLILTPVLTHIFKSNSVLPFIIFVPVWIIGFAGAVDGGYISGNLLFIITGAVGIIAPLTKLGLSAAFVETGHPELVYLAIPLSMLISFLIGWYFARRIKSKEIEIKEGIQKPFPAKFFASSVVNMLSGIVFLSLDIILAKLFLSPADAGRYTLISLVGKMIYFFGSQFSPFIIPLISRHEGKGEKSESTFNKLLIATAISSLIAFVGIGIFGKYTAPLLYGSKILSVTSFLPIYTFAMVFQTLANSIVLYHQSKNEHGFPYLGFVFSLIQVTGMLIFHADISELVDVMFFGGMFYFAAMLTMHFNYQKLKSVARNTLDFLGLFAPTSTLAPEVTKDKLNILIFNWRDTNHVWSGGAEVYVHELAKRWVKMGHEVTLFCGNDTTSPRNDSIDGVTIIRRGGFYTVFLWAFLYYITKFRGHFDLIIDSENGIPFFTPIYAKEKVYLLIHHVHQDVFRIRLKPPISWVGLLLEKYLVPLVYKNTEVITVSPSSKADILEHKLTRKEPHVIYNGVDLDIYKPGKKSVNPMVLYLGRLSPQKSLAVFIKSAKKIIRKVPNVEFIIAGDGTERKNLITLVKSLHLGKRITFTGKVTQSEKVELYQKAWVFVNPSLIEGWGITSIEANACGTPVIASNVAGLRDSIHNPHSGLLVPYGDIEEFAKTTVSLLKDKKTRNSMSSESVEWASHFDWDKSAVDCMSLF